MRSIGRRSDLHRLAAAGHGSSSDVDGNEYVDYVCSWGPLILGHAYPRRGRGGHPPPLGDGTSFGAPTAGEVELAEHRSATVCRPIEMVRMTSSGTEATMSALRLARAVTGRSTNVLKFAGAYHGHVDGLLAQAGSGLATQSHPGQPGCARGRRGRRPWSRRSMTSRSSLGWLIEDHRTWRRSSRSRSRPTWGWCRLPSPAFWSFCARLADQNGRAARSSTR